MPRAAKVAKLKSINPGLITIKHPKKPIITATHLLNPTFSFKKIGEKYTKLFINKGNTGANSIIKGWNPSVKSRNSQQFEYVESKSFDQIIDQGKVEIDDVLAIKIDVEGMEELV